MDLRHLRYFIAVAEDLSFTRAAARLHIAQPPLSLQIRQLEEELGVTLLHRTRRIVEISDAGRVFLEQARQIIRATQSAVVQAQRAQRGEIGQLAVGFFEHMSYTLLPPILSTYRERFPSVNVVLRWFPVIGQADALARGDVDVSFMRAVPGIEEVQRQTILNDTLMLALPATHPLAAKKAIALRRCADERFIMYVPNLAPDFHNIIVKMCANAGFVPQIALEVGQVYTALGLVSSGVGLAFVPTSVKRVQFSDVIYKPIIGSTPKIEIMLGWRHRNPSPLLMAFVDTAKLVAQAAHPTQAESPRVRPPSVRA